MKLTPLGKLLFFLVGLGLIVTAVVKFVPPERQPWRAWFGGAQAGSPAAPAVTTSRATPPAPVPATSSPAPTNARLAGGRWVSIPAGPFGFGSDNVTVDLPAFMILRTEVTNGEYADYLRACAQGSSCGPRELPSYWDDRGYVETHRDHPVVFVSWSEASNYCRWLGGRLPSATEWEKAARGTDGRAFPGGAALDPTSVNLLGADRREEKNRAEKQIPTWAVTEARYGRDASPYGVLGMSANVSEWTSTASEEEPDLRIAAGGSWDSWDLSDARVYHRLPKNPNDRSSSLGFRCVNAPGGGR